MHKSREMKRQRLTGRELQKDDDKYNCCKNTILMTYTKDGFK